eukprot:755441-Hanusia_phi.AAC.7
MKPWQIGSVKFTDSPPPFIATDLCRERITNCPADSRRRLRSHLATPRVAMPTETCVSVLKNEFPEVDFSQCIQSEHDSMWFDHKEDSQLCTSLTRSSGESAEAVQAKNVVFDSLNGWLSDRSSGWELLLTIKRSSGNNFQLLLRVAMGDAGAADVVRQTVRCEG